MNFDELFISVHELPDPLSKQEVYELLDKIKQGDKQANEKLVEHNIRLVLYEVTNRFNTVDYDKKELVSVGLVGLMKSITTFDTSKKVEFATYATRCIDNEILMFLRKLKKHDNDDSIDRTINNDKDGNELKLEDTLSSEIDIEEEYTDNEMYHVIREIVKELPERDRKIIELYFGFHNEKRHTQQEIADMLSLSQSYISRLRNKIVKQVGKKLEQTGLIELRKKQKNNNKKEGENKMARQMQTIYEYFNSYTKEEVDKMLGKLSEEEKALITLRYGEDLSNPSAGKLNKEQTNKFYGSLIPKMKRLLANPTQERKYRKKKTQNTPAVEQNEMLTPNEQLNSRNQEIIIENSNEETMTKEDYIKTLELLKTPSFTKMIRMCSTKEAMIVSLKLGYVDGKYFSTSAISEFLGIEQQEVIDITRKVLLTYKKKMNEIIDSAIQITTEEPEITVNLHRSLNRQPNKNQ